MKQYVIKFAYTDNYHVLQYVNGELESHNIVSYWELGGYISALEDMGYARAYYVAEYKFEMLKAKEQYEFAMERYEEAMKKPLALSEQQVEVYRKITHLIG